MAERCLRLGRSKHPYLFVGIETVKDYWQSEKVALGVLELAVFDDHTDPPLF